MEEHQTVSEILAATDHYYRRTGTLYALIVVAIGIVYPMVVHFTLPRGVVLLYTILYGLPSVTSFFVQGKYRLLMDVDGRRYVLSNLETATNLISGIGKVLVLMLTQNLLAMQRCTACAPCCPSRSSCGTPTRTTPGSTTTPNRITPPSPRRTRC